MSLLALVPEEAAAPESSSLADAPPTVTDVAGRKPPLPNDESAATTRVQPEP